MDNQNPSPIPFSTVERMQSCFERSNRRLWILCIILIVALIGSNAGWIWYENQWIDEVSVEQEAEWDSGDIIMNGTGEVNVNGESKTKDN